MEKDINKRLILVRYAFNESVYGFAKILNISQTTLLRYEKAERKITSSLLIALADICNLNINWLLTGQGEMFIGDKQHNDPLYKKSVERL